MICNVFPLKPDTRSHYFMMPNEIHSLKLSCGAIAVYSYLMRCENRKTYQCWPSYDTIGEAVGMSRNTVSKYIAELVDKELITAEPTQYINNAGLKVNGRLLITIRPIRDAVECFNRRQFAKLEADAARQKTQAKLEKLSCGA